MTLFSLDKGSIAPRLEEAVERGFASQVLDGVNVGEWLQGETGSEVLQQVVAIARKFHEPVWVEAAARRLVDVDPTPQNRMLLASVLASNNRIDEATGLHSGIADGQHVCNEWRETQGVLLAKQGQTEEALAVFETLEGHVPGFHPAPVVFPTAADMLAQCPLDVVFPFVSALAAKFPAHPLAQALGIRGHLFNGDFETARELALSPSFNIDDAGRYDRRSFLEAVAAVLSLTGSRYDLFEFVCEKIAGDRSHWSFYSLASDAARAIWRKEEYEQLLAEIPAKVADTAGALAVRCRWCIDEHHLDEAKRLMAALRSKSASLFLNVRLYMAVHQHTSADVEKAFADCMASGIPRAGPVVGYCMYRYYIGNDPEEIVSLLGRLEEHKDVSKLDALFWQTYLRCLIAADRDDDARRCFYGLPDGLRKTERLWPFEMYFRASDGKHAEARSEWTRFIRASRHFCVNSRTSYPATVKLRYEPRPGAILLFANIFNGVTYLDWFLDHYRSLGVDHFFITDNNSTDGTLERILGEEDVSVFSNRDSFAASAFGVVWTNHMMQRFGNGHWCFHVDVDEGFIFPGQDRGKTLADLISYLDSEGYGTLAALELDMYPERLAGGDTADLFAANCYFDTDYFTTRSEIPPYVIFQGGIRQRMTGLALSMHKSPLVRVSPDVRYVECNHDSTHLPVADVTAAVLHYKFVGDMKKRIDEAVGRGEHFAGAVSYRRLNEAADRHGWTESLLSEFSRRYHGPASVEKEGLIRTSDAWEAHTCMKATAEL